MNEENIKRTFAIAYVATGITQVAEISYNFLLYKSFPIDEIGLFAWVAAVVVFFNMAINLGIEPILTRKFGRDHVPIGKVMLAIVIPRAPIILLGLVVVTVLFKFDQFDDSKYWMLVLVGAQSIFNVSDGVCKAWLRANSRQANANLLAAIIGILKLTAIVVLTRFESGTIYQLMFSLIVVRALVSIVAYRMVKFADQSNKSKVDEPLISLSRGLLSAGLVVGGIGLITAVQNRFDWILVSHFISAEALASYSLANKFYEISQVIVGAALTTIYPWMCRADVNVGTVHILMRLVLVGGAIIAAGGVILGPALIGALFADKYAGIEAPVVILMLAVGYMAASGVLYQLALANGHERSLFVVAVVTTTLQVVANLWLIPRFGIGGAAFGMLLLVVTTSVGLSFVVWKRGLLSGLVVLRMQTFLVIFICLMGLLSYIALPIWLAMSLSVIGLVLIAWWLLFKESERKILRFQLTTMMG